MDQQSSSNQALRVLHAPVNIGGNAVYMAKAQRELGLDAKAVEWEPSELNYPIDAIINPAQSSRFLAREIARWRFLNAAQKNYDVFHFYFGQTLLTARRYPQEFLRSPLNPMELARVAYARLIHMRDLPLLKRRGKIIAMTFLGDDVRMVDHANEHHEVSHLHHPELKTLYRHRDDAKREMIKFVSQYADQIYATNPDILEVLPSSTKFLPYTNFSKSSPASTKGQAKSASENQEMVVAHSPTDRLAKGTREIIESVERLNKEGLPIRLDLIENVPNAEAKKRIASADIFVDQLLVGWYGGAAVEAMVSGTPAFCYIRPSDFALSGIVQDEFPIIKTNVSDLADDLRAFYYLPVQDRLKMGQRSKEFALEYHDAKKIAASVIADYQNALSLN